VPLSAFSPIQTKAGTPTQSQGHLPRVILGLSPRPAETAPLQPCPTANAEKIPAADAEKKENRGEAVAGGGAAGEDEAEEDMCEEEKEEDEFAAVMARHAAAAPPYSALCAASGGLKDASGGLKGAPAHRPPDAPPASGAPPVAPARDASWAGLDWCPAPLGDASFNPPAPASGGLAGRPAAMEAQPDQAAPQDAREAPQESPGVSQVSQEAHGKASEEASTRRGQARLTKAALPSGGESEDPWERVSSADIGRGYTLNPAPCTLHPQP